MNDHIEYNVCNICVRLDLGHLLLESDLRLQKIGLRAFELAHLKLSWVTSLQVPPQCDCVAVDDKTRFAAKFASSSVKAVLALDICANKVLPYRRFQRARCSGLSTSAFCTTSCH